MLDVAVAYNRFRFLGNEFLTWLWFTIENEPESLKHAWSEPISLEIGNRIVLENRIRDAVETVTIKGDEANLEEGILALRKGAVVIEMNLHLQTGDQQWTFTIKGESLSFSNFKTPFAGPGETEEDIAGLVIQKVDLFDQPVEIMKALFARFIKLRISDQWRKTGTTKISTWLKSHDPAAQDR
jgi:hypothetical protein